jgi:PiT family inorganic phosphate transporter
LAAQVATAVLVTTASIHGLPVSTTHVSVGCLTGNGALTGQAHWKKVGQIGLSWVITLPCAALLAALGYAAVRPQVEIALHCIGISHALGPFCTSAHP